MIGIMRSHFGRLALLMVLATAFAALGFLLRDLWSKMPSWQPICSLLAIWPIYAARIWMVMGGRIRAIAQRATLSQRS